MRLSVGKLRGLQACTSPQGTFTCLALDHRQNLRRSFNPSDPASVPDHALSEFKLHVTAALAGEATAVLLDPEYSAAQAVAAGVLPGKVGLVVALEATGYTGEPAARVSRILPGWGVGKSKRMGADAIKLLVYYHPDSSTAPEVEALIRQVADECRDHDLALMLEPLSYSLEPGQRLSSAERRRVVVETARRLTPLGVDVLKIEFPLDVTVEEGAEPDLGAWSEACAEISSVSAVPWILLSAAADFDTYLQQVTVACQAGASGIAVGRAVWKEAVHLPGEEGTAFLRTVGQQRLSRLRHLCSALGKPFSDFYTSETPFDWYRTYGQANG